MNDNEEFNQEEYDEEIATFLEIKKLRQGYKSAFVNKVDLPEKEEVYDWALDTDMNPDWDTWEKELNMTEQKFPHIKEFLRKKKK